MKPMISINGDEPKSITRWDADLIRAMRKHINASQAKLAEIIGVRPQTISEWECGDYLPKRSMCMYLTIIAERVGFQHEERK